MSGLAFFSRIICYTPNGMDMTEAKRPLKVFLCHAHSDKDTVKALYDRLTQDGVDAWLDKEKLLPGQDWEFEIRKAVHEADVVVVCLSKQFNQAGFRQKEVRLALDTAMEKPAGEIFIIPARLEECDTLETLTKWHWVDMFGEEGYAKLVSALKKRSLNLEHTTLEVPGFEGENFNQSFIQKQSGSVDYPTGNGKELIFRIDQQVLEKYFLLLFIVCMALSAIMGGLLWNLLNILLGWTFNSGGSGNEPHGFQAFIWGIISFSPVIFFAGLAGYRYILSKRESLWKFGSVVMLYSIFGGVGAIIFYDLGFRDSIEALNLGYGSQELVIVIIWAFLLSFSISFPLLIFSRYFSDILNFRYIALQTPLSMIFVFLAIIVSLLIHRPENEVAQLRGFFAAVALRLGLFFGMYLAISQKLYKPK